ncbi:hypothetical protein [Methylobacterium oryzisoli]|uniref:hypothetical protein n=1 Tax=Methylobacterium oryzisoli TaxID=3385502 RepID=UPI00389276F8
MLPFTTQRNAGAGCARFGAHLRAVGGTHGLVVYMEGCLQQHVRIAIHDAEPDRRDTEPMSEKPWTQVETAAAKFLSRRFTLSSPLMPDPLPCGPFFRLEA